MKNSYLFTVGLVLAMGCGVKTAPISSLQKTTTKTDSTTVKKQTVKDSTTYAETVERKTLPSSSVDLTLTLSQLDSVIRSLKAMPIKTREIVKTDPRFHTILKFKLDSIGRLLIQCASTEREYWERSIKETQYHAKTENELKNVTKERDTLKEEIKQLKQNFFQRMAHSFDNLLVKILVAFVAFGLVCMLAEYVYHGLLKKIFGFFTPKK